MEISCAAVGSKNNEGEHGWENERGAGKPRPRLTCVRRTMGPPGRLVPPTNTAVTPLPPPFSLPHHSRNPGAPPPLSTGSTCLQRSLSAPSCEEAAGGGETSSRGRSGGGAQQGRRRSEEGSNGFEPGGRSARPSPPHVVLPRASPATTTSSVASQGGGGPTIQGQACFSGGHESMTEAEGEISKAIVLLLVKDKLVQVVMAGADEREGGGVVDKDAMAAFAESSHIFIPLSHVS